MDFINLSQTKIVFWKISNSFWFLVVYLNKPMIFKLTSKNIFLLENFLFSINLFFYQSVHFKLNMYKNYRTSIWINFVLKFYNKTYQNHFINILNNITLITFFKLILIFNIYIIYIFEFPKLLFKRCYKWEQLINHQTTLMTEWFPMIQALFVVRQQ